MLTIVVPMFEERARVEPTIRDVVATLDRWGLQAEIITVDDGSTDGTASLVERVARTLVREGSGAARGIRLLVHERNRGKGAAVRTGLESARAPWVLMMDADNATGLGQLPKLLDTARTTGAGLVAGSRAAPDADVRTEPLRRAGGAAFRAALGALGIGYVRDTQCGFKLYRRDAAALCAQLGREDGFAFDLEHLGLCKLAGLGIAEVGVRWDHREGGTIRIVRDGLGMLAQAWRIRRRLGSLGPESLNIADPGDLPWPEVKPQTVTHAASPKPVEADRIEAASIRSSRH